MVNVSGGGVVFSEWITVRTGDDSKSNVDCVVYFLFLRSWILMLQVLQVDVSGQKSTTTE